ncbi:MAG: hypothetical protein JWM20_686 [Patescibacteria group bacterium]|nr:hypothetical protein [Patescibacteria group bacterium]
MQEEQDTNEMPVERFDRKWGVDEFGGKFGVHNQSPDAEPEEFPSYYSKHTVASDGINHVHWNSYSDGHGDFL